MLDALEKTFWERGFDAASLDDLAAAARLNRPSLYGAFGNKEDMYVRAIERFAGRLEEVFRPALATADLPAALRAFYQRAIELYATGARGCLVLCTAPVATITQPRIRQALVALLEEIDEALRVRFSAAGVPDAAGKAKLAAAVLHSIAVRARAGERRTELERFARTATALVIAPTH